MELTVPAFVFQARTGPHLPTLEGWKAELAQSYDIAMPLPGSNLPPMNRWSDFLA